MESISQCSVEIYIDPNSVYLAEKEYVYLYVWSYRSRITYGLLGLILDYRTVRVDAIDVYVKFFGWVRRINFFLEFLSMPKTRSRFLLSTKKNIRRYKKITARKYGVLPKTTTRHATSRYLRLHWYRSRRAPFHFVVNKQIFKVHETIELARWLISIANGFNSQMALARNILT